MRQLDAGGELLEEGAEIDRLQVIAFVQVAVNQRERPHPHLDVAEGALATVALHRLGLQVQQAGDDLKIVFDPVVDLAQHRFAGLDRFAKLAVAPGEPVGQLVEGDPRRRAVRADR